MGDDVTLDIKETGGGGNLDRTYLAQAGGQAEEACENCDEPSGSTKCGEFSGITLLRGVT